LRRASGQNPKSASSATWPPARSPSSRWRVADWLRIAELVARYRDLPLGTVDASVVSAAERLGITEIAAIDRRHFTVVRPDHVGAFTLLP
jgi:hypothetical protein